ncbi:MAG: ion channel [Pseudomonadota bacterium]
MGEMFGIAMVLATRFPLSFPILFLVVIIVSALFSFIASWGVLFIMEAVQGDRFSWEAFDSTTNTISLLIFAFFLWGFMLQVLVVLADLEKDRARDRIVVLCELLFSMVVIFAALHYYVAVFTDEAYEGLQAVQMITLDQYGEAVGKILSVPTAQTAVDFLYFSTVTLSALGYGDMHPVGTVAKLLTVIQIIFGFSVIIVALGRAFGQQA